MKPCQIRQSCESEDIRQAELEVAMQELQEKFEWIY